VDNELRVLVVKDHQLSVQMIDVRNDSASAIHDIIGNWFTTAFSVYPMTNRNITGFCDDEGLLNDAKPNAVMGPTLRTDMQPIHGPIVIVGGTRDGESRSLTDEEIAAFKLVDDEMVGIVTLMTCGTVLPVLMFEDATTKKQKKAKRN
jgi:hypothetical protein